MAVELGPKQRGLVAEDRDHLDHKVLRAHDQQLRWLALAIHIEDLVLSDQIKSYADIARLCGVSRARVSRILYSSSGLIE